jgi:peptidoglycan hydrolase-like protein with peptidoglycan-binding domain
MINLKKISPIIIFGVPILIGGYFIYKSLKKPKKDEGGNSNGNEGNAEVEKNSKGGGTPAVAKLFPLKKGSKGSKVGELQEAILIFNKDLYPLVVDKDFGSRTENAVKAILGKKTVDSQDDIDKIISLASKNKSDMAAAAANAKANEEKIILAEKLLKLKNSNKYLDFYAIVDTIVKEYDLTSDGRQVNEKTFTYKKNNKIEAGNSTIRISGAGDFTLDLGKKRYYFTPYGFELR